MNDYSNPYDGGPAYPGPRFSEGGHHTGHGMGMNLRDWFAGQALTGIIGGYYSNPDMGGRSECDHAKEAYRTADAMLAARDERANP